jgi:hypothetical protein
VAGELKLALDKNTKKMMPPALLRAHIAGLFKKARVGTLCTTNGQIPRGTPLEYFADGMDLYIATQYGVKLRNLKSNGNVSLSITNAVKVNWEKKWDKVWGMQVTGTCEVFGHGSPGWQRGYEVIDYGTFLKALGMSGSSIAPSSRVLKVTIKKIELFDYALLHRGYSYRQLWRPVKPGA